MTPSFNICLTDDDSDLKLEFLCIEDNQHSKQVIGIPILQNFKDKERNTCQYNRWASRTLLALQEKTLAVHRPLI